MLSIQSNPQVYGARSVAFKSTEDDIKMRDEYTARRCFYEIGYESFLFHTKPHDYECNYDISYMREQNEFVPCKSADGQCSFYCPQYWCCIRGIWTPD